MSSEPISHPKQWEPAKEEEGWTDTFRPQTEWGVGRKGLVSNSVYLLLALFLGGAGAGTALISLYLERAQSDWYFVIGFILAVGGKGLFHMLFLGSPLRFWRAVFRPQTSWISRGIIALSLFSLAGLLYILGPILQVFPVADAGEKSLAIACAVLLSFLIVYDGFLLSAAKAIGAWNTSLMIVLFPVFSALGGAGVIGSLYGLIHDAYPLDIDKLHQIESVLLVAGAFALAAYVWALYSDAFQRSSAEDVISGRLRWVFWIVVVAGGIVAPLVVAALSLSADVSVAIMSTVALVAVASDYAFKFVIFSIGGYRQVYVPSTLALARSKRTIDVVSG